MKKLTILIALAIAVAVAIGLLSGPAGFGPGTAVGASTFTVNTTGDASDASAGDGTCETATAGECTLRAAIEEANDLAGADTIAFNIPGAGPHTISPASTLPDITDPVTIDGTTEPDFAGSPVIELEGSGAGAGVNGLTITAGSSTVRGLVINRFLRTTGTGRFGNGILLETGGGNTIEGNYIGTDVTGTVDLGNDIDGVFIFNAPNNTIGGTTAASRNIISGSRRGVRISGSAATGNVVLGNYIGTDVTGTTALGNSNDEGVLIINASNNTIGGTTAGARNIIAGFAAIWGPNSDATGNVVQGNYIGTDVTGTVALTGSSGVQIFFGASGNTIGGTTAAARNIITDTSGVLVDIRGSDNIVQGNYIGTDVTGTVPLGGGKGVNISADISGIAANNIIGGTTAGARNIISGNGQGVVITSSVATGNVVQGNYIGTDVTGTVALGNRRGVFIADGAANNTIGGTVSGAGNIIAFNRSDGGVVVNGDSSTGNAILSNSIFSNGALGIDLTPTRPGFGGSGDGVTLNDAGDGDIGANNLQNFPVLTSAVSGSTNIEGSLNSTANTEFRIEFFANTACDPSGNGEGETFLGFDTVTTGGTGGVSFSVSFPTTVAVGQFITATATDPAGNTSEFSQCVAVTAAPAPVGGLVVDLGEGPLPAAQPSGGSAGRHAGTIAGIATLAVALTGAAWYARRRWR